MEPSAFFEGLHRVQQYTRETDHFQSSLCKEYVTGEQTICKRSVSYIESSGFFIQFLNSWPETL